ncbi:MAG: hypothetical protein CR980_00505 [Propionibacteriales bacterium]|nr:MAG: hypothetical protein CR980_00505 [Propionibacteriales bacterium]
MLPTDLAEFAEESTFQRLGATGDRIRRECAELPPVPEWGRPRAILLVGAEARLLRAALEVAAPCPVMASTNGRLPLWLGESDLVVILDVTGSQLSAIRATEMSRRRQTMQVVVAPAGSPVAETAGSRAVFIADHSADPIVAVIAALAVLNQLGLSGDPNPDLCAEVADQVTGACSPLGPKGENLAAKIAESLGAAVPLVWGGGMLAARASRRVAEAIRRASGEVALAADSEVLVSLIRDSASRDPSRRPSLLLLTQENPDDMIQGEENELIAAAATAEANYQIIKSVGARSGLANYVHWVLTGSYVAAYLAAVNGRLG